MIFLPMQTKAQTNKTYEYLELQEDGSIKISPQNSGNLIKYIEQLKKDAQYKDKYFNLKETTDQLLAIKDKKIELKNKKIVNLNKINNSKDKKIDNLNEIIDKKETDIKTKLQYSGSGAAIMAGIILLTNLK